MFVGFNPDIFAQIGQEITNRDRIELIPHFANIQDPLLQGIWNCLYCPQTSRSVASR
ncbi:MAG: hypothetical protein ACRC06_14050 [Waterburya sp.]